MEPSENLDRPFIAALTLQGLLVSDNTEKLTQGQIVRLAVDYADALIAELAKPKADAE